MARASAQKQASRERLFLLDGMALAYRAYFSFISRPLLNSRGENTSAIFGFVNTLMKILNDEKPEHIAVVFDTREPTFRHVMYGPYKATREKMPEDMSGQMEKLKEVVKAFNVPCLELPGYEADDIMGTLARRAERARIDTFLVTGDKDFMQLVSDHIRMYRPGKRGDDWEIVDETGVLEKFGVAPGLVIDVLGLIGDKSDNVPGVHGIGEKTAIPLVREFGSIESIIANIHRIPQKSIRERITEHTAEALLSKKLVTIDVNVPIDVDLHQLNARPRDSEKLAKLFGELEFRTLLKKVVSPPAEGPGTAAPESGPLKPGLRDITSDSHVYHLVATREDVKRLAGKLGRSSLFSFDTETSDLDPLQCEIVGLSFAVTPGEAWYVPVRPPADHGNGIPGQGATQAIPEVHPGTPAGVTGGLFGGDAAPAPTDPRTGIAGQTGLPPEDVLRILTPVLTNPALRKVGQNIKYDMLVMAGHGVRLEGASFDTMVASYVLRPENQHNLDALAADHLQYKTITYDELTGTGKDRKKLRTVDVARIAEYSAQDADITFRLYTALKTKLEEQKLLGLCESIEFPLIPVLADMEFAGVSLDVGYLQSLSKEMERVLQNLTADIHRMCGEVFNINSTQQLSRILFDKLKLSASRKTKTGFSTDVFVLEELRDEHPVIGALLEYRQVQKLKSTYIDALPGLINPRTGRVHTSFNQTIASTGRLSSSNPNFQNIPIRTEIGRGIRKAFIPGKPGMRIMSADYSQIELRIMAHISGDEEMSAAFRRGEDIHSTTASLIFGVPLKEVTREMRRKSKEVNFGIMYGIGPFGLSTRLDITQPEAKELIAKYFQRFPKVNQYISDTLAAARNNGYVCTLLGRRRFFPDINSRNFTVRSNAERQAINMPIQGTAADMIKLAMIQIHRELRNERIGATMLLQVHDELVFEVSEADESRARDLVVEKMKSALPLSVPVEVEVGVGKNWLEAH